MARVSAILALCYLPFIAFVIIQGFIVLPRFGIDALDTVKIFALIMAEAAALLAGALVVLLRKKPGLRLLSAAWAFAMAYSLSSSVVVQADPVTPIELNLNANLTAGISLIGLTLALLARRPHHKG